MSKRRGRDRWRGERLLPVQVCDLPHGVRAQIDRVAGVMVVAVADYVAQVDLTTGEIERKAEFSLTDPQKDTVTKAVLDVLAYRGLEPRDPLEVRDSLFG